MAEIIAQERAEQRRREGIKRINEAIDKIDISMDRQKFEMFADTEANKYVRKQNPNSFHSFGRNNKTWVFAYYTHLWKMYWKEY